jgi:hypothetical protein
MIDRPAVRENVPEVPTVPHISVQAASGVDELHELRVRIPVNLHRQLLSLKVLRGRSLAETVSFALDNYFAQVKTPEERPPRTQ